LEPGLKKQISNYTDREKVKINKKLLIYLFFLFISIGLWYLNALSKEYTTSIFCPVKYGNFPKGKALISDLPEKLELKVKGLGFNILRYKITSYSRTISLPIDNFRLDISRKGNEYVYYLLTRYTKEWIANQLSNDIQLIEVFPDTLIFRFTDVVEKKVPVKPVLDLRYEKQYMQNGTILVRPDSVLVNGPEVLIDTLTYVYTTELKAKNLKDTLSQEIGLQPMNKLSLPLSKILVSVPIEKFTELSLSVPIESDNTPEGLRVRTFPGFITVSCLIGVSAYDKMTPYMFRAVVDYNKLIDNTQNKAKISLVKSPSVAHDIRFYPKSVEYLIEK
jgi:hypothetical protein